MPLSVCVYVFCLQRAPIDIREKKKLNKDQRQQRHFKTYVIVQFLDRVGQLKNARIKEEKKEEDE